MADNIFFSIIIPAFNVGAFLTDAIKSILTQTYGNFEIIVIDDNSHDDTFAIAEEMSLQDSRIKVFRQTNGNGAAAARNSGIKLANGDYLLFVDADDYFLRNDLFFHLNNSIVSNGYPDVVYFGYNEGNKRYTNGEIPKDYHIEVVRPDRNSVIRRTIYPNNQEFSDYSFRAATPWAKAFNSQFIKQHHVQFPSDVRNSEDAIFNLRVLKNNPSILKINIQGYYYWINPDNSCHRYMPAFKNELPNIIRIFTNEAQAFSDIPEFNERLNLRLYSYVHNVLAQYYLHPAHQHNSIDRIEKFIEERIISHIAHSVNIRFLTIPNKFVAIGIRLNSLQVIKLGINYLPLLKSKLLKLFPVYY